MIIPCGRKCHYCGDLKLILTIWINSVKYKIILLEESFCLKMNPEEYELSKDNFICVQFLISLGLLFALFTTVKKKCNEKVDIAY
jgi:hypothetical protein